MDEIDALRDAALSLMASCDGRRPPDAIRIRQRAARLIRLADRMERYGGSIMTDQPTLSDGLRLRA